MFAGNGTLRTAFVCMRGVGSKTPRFDAAIVTGPWSQGLLCSAIHFDVSLWQPEGCLHTHEKSFAHTLWGLAFTRRPPLVQNIKLYVSQAGGRKVRFTQDRKNLRLSASKYPIWKAKDKISFYSLMRRRRTTRGACGVESPLLSRSIPELSSLISCQGPETPACFKSFEAFKMKLWSISRY